MIIYLKDKGASRTENTRKIIPIETESYKWGFICTLEEWMAKKYRLKKEAHMATESIATISGYSFSGLKQRTGYSPPFCKSLTSLLHFFNPRMILLFGNSKHW